MANSYLDPVYDQYERDAASQAGIDPGLLRAIRTRGERSNANQVSSAGARTVYQIIPSTRAGLMRNYGVDPYTSPQAAALGAALVLKEGLQRNRGNVEAAVGEYHGGIDRRNWGSVNAAYRARVAGNGDTSMPVARPMMPTGADAARRADDRGFHRSPSCTDSAATRRIRRAVSAAPGIDRAVDRRQRDCAAGLVRLARHVYPPGIERCLTSIRTICRRTV
ncbi:transglycosylase SLT domain-containing protein [Burkholderia cenocepacia]|uniref:transglycosylase SLT domain-containing protein n=1 Tax=Burkholderia cenocepacia TaxID=95486 RepID=UPI001BAC07AF|nr:transglycosylase SLT domain-containing protein [Burkholderia cenocepacia]QUN44703.1 transglycosylase SLT domain-containing protein [Burkholderia cenocepacia]